MGPSSGAGTQTVPSSFRTTPSLGPDELVSSFDPPITYTFPSILAIPGQTRASENSGPGVHW